MNDTELFELCKKVYKRTGWRYTQRRIVKSLRGQKINDIDAMNVDLSKHEELSPLYTSDYLLEKLPKILLTNADVDGVWTAGTYGWYDIGWLEKEVSDTPLKALLKLTLALDDAGELKS